MHLKRELLMYNNEKVTEFFAGTESTYFPF
jgi:hypothetical protein